MKAITTRYYGPTGTKGARIRAYDSDGNNITISYPHELSGEAVYREAAIALCRKMNWSGELAGGGIKGGYVFVFVNAQTADTERLNWIEENVCELSGNNQRAYACPEKNGNRRYSPWDITVKIWPTSAGAAGEKVFVHQGNLHKSESGPGLRTLREAIDAAIRRPLSKGRNNDHQ